MIRLLSLALLVLLHLAIHPARAQDGVGAESDSGQPSVTENDIAEDARIAERIRAILIELDGYDGVSVMVRSGIVILSGEIVDATALTRLEALVSTMDGVIAIQNEVAETTDLAKRLNPAVERMQRRIQQSISALPLVAVALGAACVIWFAGLRVSRLRNPWDRLAPNAFIADIYRQIVLLLFLLGGIVVALDILNATALLSTILGAAGIIGLAIGFAVRDTVENFIASIMLSIRQPFHPNDTVEIDGDEGKVIRLTSRATILLSFDGNHIRIPNATVFKSRIVNYSRNAERRFSFAMMVDPDSDLAEVRQLIEDTVSAMPFTLTTPGTAVWIEELTPAAAVFTVTGWIDQRTTSLLRARGETLRHVKQAIEDAGITIPDDVQSLRILPRDAAQGPRRPPVPGARPQVIGVHTHDDEALDDLIAQERKDDSVPDLLRGNAPME